eukprot:TRINITY_DN24725_c0_g1_i2.p1 TRINITY_DN24725_c0_g1~~TRINITY_DN24725_c0_g1_i2.p1  ORF type:complete len:746 (-),score=142.87 TRINITY_DN24725_c0_g1_i2:78-2315(-)
MSDGFPSLGPGESYFEIVNGEILSGVLIRKAEQLTAAGHDGVMGLAGAKELWSMVERHPGDDSLQEVNMKTIDSIAKSKLCDPAANTFLLESIRLTNDTIAAEAETPPRARTPPGVVHPPKDADSSPNAKALLAKGMDAEQTINRIADEIAQATTLEQINRLEKEMQTWTDVVAQLGISDEANKTVEQTPTENGQATSKAKPKAKSKSKGKAKGKGKSKAKGKAKSDGRPELEVGAPEQTIQSPQVPQQEAPPAAAERCPPPQATQPMRLVKYEDELEFEDGVDELQFEGDRLEKHEEEDSPLREDARAPPGYEEGEEEEAEQDDDGVEEYHHHNQLAAAKKEAEDEEEHKAVPYLYADHQVNSYADSAQHPASSSGVPAYEETRLAAPVRIPSRRRWQSVPFTESSAQPEPPASRRRNATPYTEDSAPAEPLASRRSPAPYTENGLDNARVWKRPSAAVAKRGVRVSKAQALVSRRPAADPEVAGGYDPVAPLPLPPREEECGTTDGGDSRRWGFGLQRRHSEESAPPEKTLAMFTPQALEDSVGRSYSETALVLKRPAAAKRVLKRPAAVRRVISSQEKMLQVRKKPARAFRPFNAANSTRGFTSMRAIASTRAPRKATTPRKAVASIRDAGPSPRRGVVQRRPAAIVPMLNDVRRDCHRTPSPLFASQNYNNWVRQVTQRVIMAWRARKRPRPPRRGTRLPKAKAKQKATARGKAKAPRNGVRMARAKPIYRRPSASRSRWP